MPMNIQHVTLTIPDVSLCHLLHRNISASSLQIAAIILFLCTSLRLLVTYLSVCTSAVLLTRERLFVCLAWLPKATVQVASYT